MARRISWIRSAEKDFKKFPTAVQDQMKNALDIAALGRKADFAKPMKGLESGIFEIALPY
jgi:phage-related protein